MSVEDTRNLFIDNLINYNISIYELLNINLADTIVSNYNNKPLNEAITLFYKNYKNNETNENNKNNEEPINYTIFPSSDKYIYNQNKPTKEEKSIKYDNIKKYKEIIDTYIDTNIKPLKTKENGDFKATSKLNFATNEENTNIENDKKLYFTYQNLLQQESSTKKIGMNAVNWGYFGIATNGLSALFQMYTLYKTKSAKSFSMPFIYIMTFLNAVYCLVGILEKNIGLAVATFFFVIYNFTVIYVYYRYK